MHLRLSHLSYTYNIAGSKEAEIVSSGRSVEFKSLGPFNGSAVLDTYLVSVNSSRSESISFKFVEIQWTLSNTAINKCPILISNCFISIIS